MARAVIEHGTPSGYSYSVGEWIVRVAIPQSGRAVPLRPLRHVLEVLTPLVRDLHRLRKVVVSWGEFDARGQELAFHELVEVECKGWDTLASVLEARMSSVHVPAVSALFLELDTWVVADGSHAEGGGWVEASAELQIGFLDPEAAPSFASVMYSTSIDVWLPTTYDRQLVARSNEELSRVNRPRLEGLLASLAAVADQPMTTGQSRLYADALVPGGFRTDWHPGC